MPRAVPKIQQKRKRVIVFGVFDLLHPGHVRFLARAKRYGDELVVVVTPDHRVKQEKGHVPYHSAKERKTVLLALGVVDRVVLGDTGKHWTVIKRLNPNIIVLGPDQSANHPQIREQLHALPVKPVIKQYPRFRSRKNASSSIRTVRRTRFKQGRSVP